MNDTAILKHTNQQDSKDWQLVHLEWRSIEISGHAPFCVHCKQFFDWCLDDRLDELYHPQSAAPLSETALANVCTAW